MECFWQSIASYNSGMLLVQPLWLLLALMSVMLLWKRDSKPVRRCVRLFMAATCFWIAIAYFGIYARCRAYNEIEVAIWMLLGLIWVYDAFDPHSCSDRPRRRNFFAVFLLLAPLLYPLLSLVLGRRWPEITTPLMPCSVTVFMIGLILAFREKVNLVIVLLICHWMLLGITKATTFSLPEDYLLVIATLPALWSFMSAYIARHSSSGKFLKPSPRTMQSVLAVVFVLVIILCITPLL